MLSSLLGVASLVLGVVEWLDWPSLLAPPLGGVAMAWVILAGIRQGLERAEPTGAVVGAQPAAVAEEG